MMTRLTTESIPSFKVLFHNLTGIGWLSEKSMVLGLRSLVVCAQKLFPHTLLLYLATGCYVILRLVCAGG